MAGEENKGTGGSDWKGTGGTSATGNNGTNGGPSQGIYIPGLGNKVRYSANELINEYKRLSYYNDPFIGEFKRMYGFTSSKDALDFFSKGARYAEDLLQSGEKAVNLSSVLNSESFRSTLESSSSNGQPSSQAYINITSAENARNDLTTAMQQMLGRKPTKAEFSQYVKQLNTNERNKYKTVNYSSTAQVTTGTDFDREKFLNDFVVSKAKFGTDMEGLAGTVQDTVNQVIKNNGLAGLVDGAQKRKWMGGLLSGQLTQEQLNANVRKQSVRLYKPFAEMMNDDPTMSLAEAASPWLNVYAKTLEVGDAELDVKDALQKAINPETNEVMSVFDYEKTLKMDERFQFTSAAADAAQNMAYSFAKAFGVNI